MLTKEECMEALSELSEYAKRGREYPGARGQSVDTYVDERVTLLADIICDYFSNPSLEWGEIKEGMWVWDNKLKEWRKVIEKLIVGVSEGSEFYEDIYVKGTKVIRIGLHKFDWKDILFESKRFYRKEVQE